PATCEYQTIPDHFFPYIDRLSRAFSLSDCRRQCDLEDKFVCRSLNFETVVRDCALSSDDMISMQHMSDGLIPRPNSIYSEKGSYEQVSVQCNQQDMLLTVNFGSPFHGRVYAKGNPTQCYMVGTGQTIAFFFAISLGTRCGTLVEGSGRYANEVVIQQHPVIVTNSDKTIKVVCSFENLDRTVTLGALFPGASPGLDAIWPYLHETYMHRSKNGESPVPHRQHWVRCPTDPSIFPGLNLDARDRKSLFANFKAFRFPFYGTRQLRSADPILPRPVQTGQFSWSKVRCSNNMESFGRKKRDATDTTARGPSSPPSIKHHNSSKDNLSTGSTQRQTHSGNPHESNIKLSQFASHRFTPPPGNGTAWASNITKCSAPSE
ncbi:uncharacterized protein CEXT_189691, partial [Caerostris extrusa]